MTKTDELLKDMGDALKIEVSSKDPGTGNKKWTVFVESDIPNFPWGITKKDIEKAEDLGESLLVRKQYQEILNKALYRIKDFIWYELGYGASPKLQRAIISVWNRNFQNWSDPLMFFKGTKESNFISAVQGSMGEFQAALIFEYLRAEGTSGEAASMIYGNVYKKGEQGKTDVQIFRSLGLQIKNVTTITNNGKTSLLRDLETTIHPSKFVQYLGEGQGTTLLDFLANYYFNTSYQETMDSLGRKEELEKNLSEWLIEIMNMALVDSEVDDTISFYLIGGSYLVPCSALIRAADELKLTDSIRITSAYQGHSDEWYADEDEPPNYQHYWINKNDQWAPTGENRNIYYQLINKKISIRAKFNLIDSIEDYAIWAKN